MEIVGALALVKHLHRHDNDHDDDDRNEAGVHQVVKPADAPEPRTRTGRFQRDPERDWGGVHERPKAPNVAQ